MIIIQKGYECKYEIETFANIFFKKKEDVLIYTYFKYELKRVNVYTEIIYNDETFFEDYYYDFDINLKKERLIKKVFVESCVKSFIYAAQKIKRRNLPWGTMTGIRPVKNLIEIKEDNCFSEEEACEFLKEIYGVSEKKTKLLFEVYKNEKEIIEKTKKNSVSIYIGIPFCPTRCKYCSFVSTDIKNSGKYIPEFIEKLIKEIEKTKKIINNLGLYAENIYIGGGTPTTLSASELEKIFISLKNNFDFSKIKEFTVEAGRPDTITSEKLKLMRNFGVNRISINPQTMNNKTLELIGRNHTVEDFLKSFNMARKEGFKNINTDLIAGLPGETTEMFKKSIEEIIKIDPEDVTVHSMCIKRSSSLKSENFILTNDKIMNEMTDYAYERMEETKRYPYYMYRQKNMSGNLENTAYAKKDCMSIYNINIMAETQTIIALGGGGSTKVVLGDKIERIFNFKDPADYISRFNEILKKKDKVTELYGGII